MTEYSNFLVREPTILKLSDGSGAIKLDTFNSYWINAQLMAVLMAGAEEDAPKPEQKPEGSVSELTMLKALAIAQQPELALNLLKE